MTPVCSGDDRGFVCGLCGRPPGEPCPKTRRKVERRQCPACDGTGFWPKDSTTDCLVCEGTGRWQG